MNVARRAYEKARHTVRYFLLRRLPTCKEIAPLLSESLERPLTAREYVTVKLHLLICVWCAWYLGQLSAVRAACLLRGKQEAPPAAAELSADARERIRRALRDHAK